MPDLVVHTNVGDFTIPAGQSKTVGREGEITLLTVDGRTNPYLHGIAFEIRALGDRWSIHVPEDKIYEPLVRDDESGETISVLPDDEKVFRWMTATVSLLATYRHRLVVNFTRGHIQSASGRSGTVEPPFVLDPSDPAHRVWIVASRDRLKAAQGPSLGWPEVAAILRSTDFYEDQDLTSGAARTRAWRAYPAIEAYLEEAEWSLPDDDDRRRDAVVDFLVLTGMVTRATFGAVVSRVDR